jgi:hypothetical protein
MPIDVGHPFGLIDSVMVFPLYGLSRSTEADGSDRPYLSVSQSIRQRQSTAPVINPQSDRRKAVLGPLD